MTLFLNFDKNVLAATEKYYQKKFSEFSGAISKSILLLDKIAYQQQQEKEDIINKDIRT